jgi:hypothetical protein
VRRCSAVSSAICAGSPRSGRCSEELRGSGRCVENRNDTIPRPWWRSSGRHNSRDIVG